MQESFKGSVVLKRFEHSTKNQQHSQWRTILRQVEGLQTNLTHSINPKTSQHMNDVVGFFEAMHDELLITGDGRWVDQGVRCDALRFEL